MLCCEFIQAASYFAECGEPVLLRHAENANSPSGNRAGWLPGIGKRDRFTYSHEWMFEPSDEKNRLCRESE